jgi:hypothetical protein
MTNNFLEYNEENGDEKSLFSFCIKIMVKEKRV